MKRFLLPFLLIPFFLATPVSSAPLPANNGTDLCWIFFTDKGVERESVPQALAEARSNLNAHARWRRAKVLSDLVDERDLPVNISYMDEVAACGAEIRFASRWLNAVSVRANGRALETICSLPFIGEVRPLARYWPTYRSLETVESGGTNGTNSRSHFDDLDYGPSFTQLELSHVPEMHERGLTGNGVLLCMLDTGFWLSHEAFDSLNVIATYDFINRDSIVWNEEGQDTFSQQDHGTLTLSVAAGRSDGNLYGPAYGAELILAKTEDVRSETPIEEDYYVAGLEWADSLGAEVVSSSLGYLDWYTFEDMNGHTAVTTIAVNIAISRGIVVCTAAGNERETPWGHIIAPADADSVIAVGAVDTTGEIAPFSSPGPTADGRIKPEVCADGVDAYGAAAWFGEHGYGRASGTSLSTPITAGICVLLLEAHPDWTPTDVRAALLMTASQANSPNTDYGWGIVDGLAALDYLAAEPYTRAVVCSKIAIGTFPNPANSVAVWTIEIPQTVTGSFCVTDILGRTVARIPSRTWTPGYHRVPFELSNLPSGFYFGRFETPSAETVGKIVVLK
jgi:serine protease AprX